MATQKIHDTCCADFRLPICNFDAFNRQLEIGNRQSSSPRHWSALPRDTAEISDATKSEYPLSSQNTEDLAVSASGTAFAKRFLRQRCFRRARMSVSAVLVFSMRFVNQGSIHRSAMRGSAGGVAGVSPRGRDSGRAPALPSRPSHRGVGERRVRFTAWQQLPSATSTLRNLNPPPPQNLPCGIFAL